VVREDRLSKFNSNLPRIHDCPIESFYCPRCFLLSAIAHKRETARLPCPVFAFVTSFASVTVPEKVPFPDCWAEKCALSHGCERFGGRFLPFGTNFKEKKGARKGARNRKCRSLANFFVEESSGSKLGRTHSYERNLPNDSRQYCCVLGDHSYILETSAGR
jgi:hypothetical protein